LRMLSRLQRSCEQVWVLMGCNRFSRYLDGEVDMTTYAHTPLRSYLGTTGHADLDAQGSPVAERYYHGDLIDSAMLTTDAAGDANAPAAYTAFGELVTGYSELGTRYGYAGGWGYESDLLGLQGANTALAALTFQHLGWRWYQPDTGRFIQRDPIGLAGGLNVYDYVWGRPTIAIDPSGLRSPASCGCDCGCGCCGGGQDDPSFGEKVGAGAAGTAVGVGLGYLACTVIGISTGGVGGVIIIGVGGFVGGTTGVGISTGEVGLPAGPSGPPQPSGWGGNTDGRSEPGGPYQ
jgi:RHS repeat-associated protein